MGVSSFFYQCDDEISTSVTANCTHNSVRSGSMATQGPINSRLTSHVGTSPTFPLRPYENLGRGDTHHCNLLFAVVHGSCRAHCLPQEDNSA